MASADPTPEPTHDVIVIGGGPVGENAAQYAIEGSDRTVFTVAPVTAYTFVGLALTTDPR